MKPDAASHPGGRAAVAPPEARGIARDGVRLLVSTAGGHRHATFADLPDFLDPGTVLVVNDSATLPASLPAEGAAGPFMLNLSTDYGSNLWLAEPRFNRHRPGPLSLRPGDALAVAGLPARIVAGYPGLPRLCFVAFHGDVGRAMFEHGAPIRYGYLEPPLPSLDAFQTVFARVPGSAEMPSAARPFTPRLVGRLLAKGVRIRAVTLHTGVSSLDVEDGAPEDQAFYPEPFLVPPATAAAINHARRAGCPVVAVGTTVVRALASAWTGEAIRPAQGFTRRIVAPWRPMPAIDGLITGLHDPHGSHVVLLRALAGSRLVAEGYAEAVSAGYLWHEFGDSHLILPGTAGEPAARRAGPARLPEAPPSSARHVVRA